MSRNVCSDCLCLIGPKGSCGCHTPQVADKAVNEVAEAAHRSTLGAFPKALSKLNVQDRKERPVVTGVLDYFPDAIMAVAHCSFVGNEQHNPGSKLHWDRSKSGDEADALGRHLLQRGTLDTDGVRHSAKVAWRALAMLQKEIEQENRGE